MLQPSYLICEETPHQRQMPPMAVNGAQRHQERVHFYISGTPPSHPQGSLTLKNNETLEKHVYNLKGRGEEPLAENHIQVECRAREQVRSICWETLLKTRLALLNYPFSAPAPGFDDRPVRQCKGGRGWPGPPPSP